jgi:serine O-acetyltransferase
MNDKVSRAAHALVESYSDGGVKIHHLDRRPLPSRDAAVAALDALQELMFPGYTGAQGLTGASLRLHVESRAAWLYETLTEQIARAAGHGHRLEEACPVTERQATECAEEFIARLPRVREALATDVKAAYEGDPAARCYDEIIFSYPGLYAIMTYRLAHELHRLDGAGAGRDARRRAVGRLSRAGPLEAARGGRRAGRCRRDQADGRL